MCLKRDWNTKKTKKKKKKKITSQSQDFQVVLHLLGDNLWFRHIEPKHKELIGNVHILMMSAVTVIERSKNCIPKRSGILPSCLCLLADFPNQRSEG